MKKMDKDTARAILHGRTADAYNYFFKIITRVNRPDLALCGLNGRMYSYFWKDAETMKIWRGLARNLLININRGR